MSHFTSGKMKAQSLSHLPKIPQSLALKSLSLSYLPASRSCIPAFLHKMVQWVLTDLNLQSPNLSGTQLDHKEGGRSHMPPPHVCAFLALIHLEPGQVLIFQSSGFLHLWSEVNVSAWLLVSPAVRPHAGV